MYATVTFCNTSHKDSRSNQKVSKRAIKQLVLVVCEKVPFSNFVSFLSQKSKRVTAFNEKHRCYKVFYEMQRVRRNFDCVDFLGCVFHPCQIACTRDSREVLPDFSQPESLSAHPAKNSPFSYPKYHIYIVALLLRCPSSFAYVRLSSSF